MQKTLKKKSWCEETKECSNYWCVVHIEFGHIYIHHLYFYSIKIKFYLQWTCNLIALLTLGGT